MALASETRRDQLDEALSGASEPGGSESNLRGVVQAVATHDLIELWDSLSSTDARRVFLCLEPERRVALITSLSQQEQEQLIRSLSLDNIRSLFIAIEPDDLVDIIQAVDPDVRTSIWNSLSPEARRETQLLLPYEADDAAGLMTSRYLAIRSDLTSAQALNFIRQHGADVETIYLIYVVDQLQRLRGVVSLRDLIFAADSRQVGDTMVTDVVSVQKEADQEEAAHLLESYDLIALPVVDEYRRLLGIITFDDVIDVIRREQTEDVYKMGAMEGSTDRYTETPIWKLLRKRIPWLILLLVAGTLTSNVLSGFQSLTLAAAFLIWFVPVITQTGGNSGTQSSTLMIRGLAVGEIHFRDIGRVIYTELLVGLLMGIALGGVLFVRGLFLPPGIEALQALAVSASLALVVLFSSVMGALAPLIIHRLGFDPTLMAGPLMATVIDVAALTIYFQVARLILDL